MIISTVSVAVWYIVALVVLGIVAGFSPLLYTLAAWVSSTERNNRIRVGVSLVAGVTTGIILMFLVGGSLASVMMYARTKIGFGGELHDIAALFVGVTMLVYGAYRQSTLTRNKEMTALGTQGGQLSVGSVFLIGCAKTLLSLSGVSATIIITTGLATRDVSWVFTMLIVLPIVVVAALGPFIIIIMGDRWMPVVYGRSKHLMTRLRTSGILSPARLSWAVIALGVLLVVYGSIGLFL